MAIPRPQISSNKVMAKIRQDNQLYYGNWQDALKLVKRKHNLYTHSVRLLVNNIKDKKEFQNKPPEIKEVIKKVPYPVVNEVIKEVVREVPIEVEKKVFIEVPVVKEVRVPERVEVIKEVPVEVIKEVEKIKEVEILVPTKDVGEEMKLREEIATLQEDFDSRLKLEKLSRVALERRYQTAILQAREEERREVEARIPKKSAWMPTYIYLLSFFSLTQILWLVCL